MSLEVRILGLQLKTKFSRLIVCRCIQMGSTLQPQLQGRDVDGDNLSVYYPRRMIKLASLIFDFKIWQSQKNFHSSPSPVLKKISYILREKSLFSVACLR